MKKRRPVKLIPPLAEELKAIKHAQHDQSAHGNWARGGGGRSSKPKPHQYIDSDDAAIAIAERHMLVDGKLGRMLSGGAVNVSSKEVIEAAGKKPGVDAFFEQAGITPSADAAGIHLIEISNAMEEVANSEGIYETVPDPQGIWDWSFSNYDWDDYDMDTD